jgi:hypothetical protein
MKRLVETLVWFWLTFKGGTGLVYTWVRAKQIGGRLSEMQCMK